MEKPNMVTVSILLLPSLSPMKLPNIREPMGLAIAPVAKPPNVAMRLITWFDTGKKR